MITTTLRYRLGLALLAATLPSAASAQASAPTTAPVLESEEPFTAKLPAKSPHWAYIRGGFESGGTRIFDGDTGKMVGLVTTPRWSDLALDPAGKHIFVSETIWTKINRGTRQDYVAIYDPATLDLLAEVPMPGRLIIGAAKNNFVVSDDGKTGYVYNFSPTSSVNVVDFEKRKLAQVVELPGCASLMPTPGVGFSALCSDGTIATVAVGPRTSKITHSAPFFQASADPIFDTYLYDRTKAEAIFITYTGLIHQAKMAATPVISPPWSIQAAAGVRPGDTKPLDINWMPGGRQLMALHRATGTLYVLMHKGEYWTQKEDGEELWVVDIAAKKVTRRIPLKKHAGHVDVTQDDKPLIFLSGGEGQAAWVYDATTFEQKHEIERAGGGIIAVSEAR